MTQPLNWGILGTGMIARKFAAELKDEASTGIARVESWFKKLF